MIQIPAWVLFVLGFLFGALVGALVIIIVALTYKGDKKDGSKKDNKVRVKGDSNNN